MKPELLIDGYNVIKNTARLQAKERISLEAARNEFIKMLAGYRALHPGVEIIVVFDAAAADEFGSEQAKVSGIKVIFDRCSADSRIKKMVESDHNSRRITVVSEDRGITNYVRGLGAKILSPFNLLERLKIPVGRSAVPSDKPLPGSARETEINDELKQIWDIDQR